MPRVHHHRSLLQMFCAFALLLLIGVNGVLDLHRAHAHGAASSAATLVHDGHVLASDTHNPLDPFSGDVADTLSQTGDDCDVDDLLAMPQLMRVTFRSPHSGMVIGSAPSLRAAPSFDLLRPPRVA